METCSSPVPRIIRPPCGMRVMASAWAPTVATMEPCGVVMFPVSLHHLADVVNLEKQRVCWWNRSYGGAMGKTCGWVMWVVFLFIWVSHCNGLGFQGIPLGWWRAQPTSLWSCGTAKLAFNFTLSTLMPPRELWAFPKETRWLWSPLILSWSSNRLFMSSG